MIGTSSDWKDELERWLKPFLDRLGHKARRQMCPLYVAGLIGPGDRKSVQPMAERLAPDDYDQLHHFVSAGVWDAAPLEAELRIQADRLVGGRDSPIVAGGGSDPSRTCDVREAPRRSVGCDASTRTGASPSDGALHEPCRAAGGAGACR